MRRGMVDVEKIVGSVVCRTLQSNNSYNTMEVKWKGRRGVIKEQDCGNTVFGRGMIFFGEQISLNITIGEVDQGGVQEKMVEVEDVKEHRGQRLKLVFCMYVEIP